MYLLETHTCFNISYIKKNIMSRRDDESRGVFRKTIDWLSNHTELAAELAGIACLAGATYFLILGVNSLMTEPSTVIEQCIAPQTGKGFNEFLGHDNVHVALVM